MSIALGLVAAFVADLVIADELSSRSRQAKLASWIDSPLLFLLIRAEYLSEY